MIAESLLTLKVELEVSLPCICGPSTWSHPCFFRTEFISMRLFVDPDNVDMMRMLSSNNQVFDRMLVSNPKVSQISSKPIKSHTVGIISQRVAPIHAPT